MNRTVTHPTILASLLSLACLLAAGCDGFVPAHTHQPIPVGEDVTRPVKTVESDVAVPSGLVEPRVEGDMATSDDPGSSDRDAAGSVIVDAPLEPWRRALLGEAFAVASAMPVRLHGTDRARAQQEVVDVMLELGQLVGVVAFINQIEDWRRGDAFADLAFLRTRLGDRQDSVGYLGLAERIAESTDAWRRDRIRVNVARTHALLGRDALAEGLEFDVVPSETGVVDAVRMERLADDRLEAQLEEYGQLVATGGFDLTSNILAACVRLYDRFYEHPERRERVLAFIRDSWSSLPLQIRLERLLAVADIAIERGDPDVARPIVHEARTMLEAAPMTAEGWVPLASRVAARSARIGDVERATSELEEAMTRFDEERHLVIGMFRARLLRPIAEAYAAMQRTEEAHRIYVRAVVEGAGNPNARPRAMDLSATLASMAASGVRPDESLAVRIAEIRDGFGDPW